MNERDLMEFEKDIAESFNRAEIPYPVHLSGGNERVLINIFKDFKEGDWVFTTWRSHYHALLAGIPREKVKKKIMEGHSMTMCWPEHNFFGSAIVAGCCPIAVGVAWELKRGETNNLVWVFLGDMASQTGLAIECMRYSRKHLLPIRWVIEDNEKSVMTDTKSITDVYNKEAYYHYKYKLSYPHYGTGTRVSF